MDSLTNFEHHPGVYSAIYIPGHNVSSKRYLVSKTFIRKILEASDVKIRVDLRRSFVDGVFTDTTISSAYNGFEKIHEHSREQRIGLLSHAEPLLY